MAVAASFTIATACRDSDYDPSPTSPAVTSPTASSLVGLWKGPLNGSGGKGVVTMRLQADSTISADNENPNYTRVDGVWAVTGGRFAATGRTPAGTVVKLVAPFVSSVRLTGTWSADNGASGTFEVVKQ